jgi:hypothetical protein
MLSRYLFRTTHALAIVFVLSRLVQPSLADGFVPKDGFVPSNDTAIKIAEAILIPIYGEAQINSERPFKAEIDGDVWIVTGTLPQGVVGGVATVRISRRDGKILSVTHGK